FEDRLISAVKSEWANAILTGMQQESLDRKKAQLAQSNYSEDLKAELLDIHRSTLLKGANIDPGGKEKLERENVARVQSLLSSMPSLSNPDQVNPAKFYDYLVELLAHAEAKARQEIKLD